MSLKLAQDYKAILFDFDGVLGRTLEDNCNAWAHALAQQRVIITREEYYFLEGATVVHVAEYFLAKHNKDLGLIPSVVREKENYYIEHNSFTFYDGAERLIARLSVSPIRIGLVSGAGRGRLATTCGEEFLKTFNTVVTGEDISHGKPAPDPYLCAAERLAVRPDECLVIENAPLGIHAAKVANMDCVAISSTLDKRHLQEADVVIPNLMQICHVVRCIEKICS